MAARKTTLDVFRDQLVRLYAQKANIVDRRNKAVEQADAAMVRDGAPIDTQIKAIQETIAKLEAKT